MNKNQSREQKFKRLAPKRLENAVKSLRLIGNLSNKSHYLYSKDDANLIIRTLKEEIDVEKIDFFQGSVSETFDAGNHKKIAVKIVDNRGIESLIVRELP